MQIHELTRPRKVNEASVGGALRGAGAVIGGIAKQVGKQAMDKVLPGAGDVSGPAQDRIGAFNTTMPLVKTLSATMQKAWAETVRNYIMSSAPATGVAATNVTELTPASQSGLEQELRKLVNQSISPRNASFDYAQLPQLAGADPVATAGAGQVKQAIDKSLPAIWQGTLAGKSPNEMINLWLELGANGIAPGQNILAFDNKSGSVITLSPEAKKLAASLKLDDGDIVKIRQAIKAPGGEIKAMMILDKKAPTTITSPWIKQFGEATKLTDTELTAMLALAQDPANDAAFKEMFGLTA